jgi:HrpA-like RNA helicase
MGPTLLLPASEKLKHADHEIPKGIRAIDYITNWLRDRLIAPPSKFQGLKDRILIVKAMTGAAKSTLMPVEVFRILKPENAKQEYRGAGVLCTQPRILTAKDIAQNQVGKASWFPDMIFGETVGYQTGVYTEKPHYNNLLYATIGVLRAQLDFREDSFIMSKYKFIILDECHVRDLDTDCTMMKLKYFYLRNSASESLPFLILTSATMDTKKYASYFGVDRENIMEVEGLSFPKTTHWHDQAVEDQFQATMDKIVHIHKTYKDDPMGKGDIMIFVSSTKPWQQKMAKEIVEEKAEDLLVVFIDSDEVHNDSLYYQYVTQSQPIPEGKRRMAIFATNAAETGLTVETLKYVIDIGFRNSNESYFPYGVNGLVERPVAQSNVEQRKGRCGRKFAGDFFPLYSEKAYNALQLQEYPDTVTAGIDNIILDIIKAQQAYKLHLKKKPEFRIEDIDTLDLPPKDSILSSLEKCLAFGLISYNADLGYKEQLGYGITTLGLLVNKISRDLTLETARVLLSGYTFGVSIRDTILLAVIGHKDFSRLKKAFKNPRLLKVCLPKCFQDKPVELFRKMVSCQFIELLCVLSTFLHKIKELSVADFTTWLNDLELSSVIVTKVIKLYNAISTAMLLAGLDISMNAERELLFCDSMDDLLNLVLQLKACLQSGYIFNTLRFVPSKKENPKDAERGICYYQTRHGFTIRVQLMKDRLIEQPQVLITDSLTVKRKGFKEEIMYEIKCGLISIVDGYCGDIIDYLTYSQCRPNQTARTETRTKKTKKY